MRKAIPLILVSIFLLAAAAWADEIGDQIKRGLSLYEKGKITESISELEFALAQMRQKKGEALTQVFPKAPDGWKAEEPQVQSAGAAMLGGGINASRRYHKQGGPGTANVEIFTDSPLVQTLGMMLNNPMMLQGAKGTKPVRINGQKGVVRVRSKNRAELQLLVDGKSLLKVEVANVPDAAKIAQDFAKMVNIDKLRGMGK